MGASPWLGWSAFARAISYLVAAGIGALMYALGNADVCTIFSLKHLRASNNHLEQQPWKTGKTWEVEASSGDQRFRSQGWSSDLASTGIIAQAFGEKQFQDTVMWNRGLFPLITCPASDTKRMAEWSVCMPILNEAIVKKKCLAYIFGVASHDAFAEGIKNMGCQEVHAFDPAIANVGHWEKHGIHFHHWGLRSSTNSTTNDERKFDNNKLYGNITGEFFTFAEMRDMLKHTTRVITIMKMDCEGCEWEVFDTIYRSGGMGQINHLLTELHFSTGLRFSAEKALHRVPSFTKLIARSGLVPYSFQENVGSGRRNPIVDVPADIVKAGAKPLSCCREIGFLNLQTWREIYQSPGKHLLFQKRISKEGQRWDVFASFGDQKFGPGWPGW